jgi:photosystem II stability/assembly factor-like uncharacterized protein
MRHFLGVGWLPILTALIAACGSAADTPPDDSTGGDTTGAAGDMSSGAAGDSSGTGTGTGGSTGMGGAVATTTGTGGSVKPGTGGGGMGGSVVAPPSNWKNVTGSLANMASECGTLTMVSAKPGSNMVIAGIAKMGLWATTNGGTTWAQLGNSNIIPNRPSSIVYDPDHPDVIWESGIYNGKGIFRSDDAGMTWKQLGTIDHNDGVSVDFTDPDRKTLLAGSHETARKVWLSVDAGATWKDIGMNLPANTNHSSQPLVMSAQNFFMGVCGYLQGADCGVYASKDGGTTWTRASTLTVAGHPLVTKDKTSIYWTMIWDGGIGKSGDAGATWAKLGTPSKTDTPFELPDGRILTMNAGGQIVASADQGKTWKPIGTAPPFKPESFTYSVETKTIFVSHSSCNNNVPTDAIASSGFDYTAQ